MRASFFDFSDRILGRAVDAYEWCRDHFALHPRKTFFGMTALTVPTGAYVALLSYRLHGYEFQSDSQDYFYRMQAIQEPSSISQVGLQGFSFFSILCFVMMARAASSLQSQAAIEDHSADTPIFADESKAVDDSDSLTGALLVPAQRRPTCLESAGRCAPRHGGVLLSFPATAGFGALSFLFYRAMRDLNRYFSSIDASDDDELYFLSDALHFSNLYTLCGAAVLWFSIGLLAYRNIAHQRHRQQLQQLRQGSGAELPANTSIFCPSECPSPLVLLLLVGFVALAGSSIPFGGYHLWRVSQLDPTGDDIDAVRMMLNRQVVNIATNALSAPIMLFGGGYILTGFVSESRTYRAQRQATQQLRRNVLAIKNDDGAASSQGLFRMDEDSRDAILADGSEDESSDSDFSIDF